MLTIDLHAGQIQGFFDIPTDNLFAAPVFVDDIKQRYDGSKLMIVSPDVGGVVRARSLARRLDADLAIIDKRRPKAGVSEVMNIIGDVDDRHCVMVDDIVDSGAPCAMLLLHSWRLAPSRSMLTLPMACYRAVRLAGWRHRPQFTGYDQLDPCHRRGPCGPRNIRQLTIAPLLGEAMLRINEERSVSTLF